MTLADDPPSRPVPGHDPRHGHAEPAQGVENGEPCCYECLLGSEEIFRPALVWRGAQRQQNRLTSCLPGARQGLDDRFHKSRRD